MHRSCINRGSSSQLASCSAAPSACGLPLRPAKGQCCGRSPAPESSSIAAGVGVRWPHRCGIMCNAAGDEQASPSGSNNSPRSGSQQRRRQRLAGRQHRHPSHYAEFNAAGTEEEPRVVEEVSEEFWDPETLDTMMDDSFADEEAQVMENWLAVIGGDLTMLYEYVDVQAGAFNHAISLEADGGPQNELEAEVLHTAKRRFPSGVANAIIGMGCWRLKGALDPVIQFMVGRMEGCWREELETDMTLYPVDRWKDQGWDFADSMDPDNEWEGWAYADIPDPEKGEPGYPRLQLENRVYCSKVFRKLHIEVATRQDGLQVLHVVLYPRYSYDMPILALDVVLMNGTVSLAIVDAIPVRPGKQLPPVYALVMATLQQTYLTNPDNARTIPEWGRKIFSEGCICIRPNDPEELAGFVKYAMALHKAHMLLSTVIQPVDSSNTARGQRQLSAIHKAHRRFVKNNLSNKKTSRVLDTAFGEEWSKQYMSELMFDYVPHDEAPYKDGSITQLYDYFVENPALGTLGDEVRAKRRGMQVDTATATLNQVVAQTSNTISTKRLETAMLQLYEGDETFRDAVQDLVEDADVLKDEGLLGEVLAQQMGELGLGAGAGMQAAWTK